MNFYLLYLNDILDTFIEWLKEKCYNITQRNVYNSNGKKICSLDLNYYDDLREQVEILTLPLFLSIHFSRVIKLHELNFIGNMFVSIFFLCILALILFSQENHKNFTQESEILCMNFHWAFLWMSFFLSKRVNWKWKILLFNVF